jgi:hypothetical protein
VADVGDSLEARTKRTWRSFGERVSVELHATTEKTTVIVRSRPVIRTTITDYGKGRMNVRSVRASLIAASSPGAPTS